MFPCVILAPVSPSLPCHVCSSSCHRPCLMLLVFPVRSNAAVQGSFPPHLQHLPVSHTHHHAGQSQNPAPPLNFWATLVTCHTFAIQASSSMKCSQDTYIRGDWEDSARLFLCYVQLDMVIWANIVSNHVTLTLVQSPSSPPHCCSLPAPTSSSLLWRQSHTIYHA